MAHRATRVQASHTVAMQCNASRTRAVAPKTETQSNGDGTGPRKAHLVNRRAASLKHYVHTSSTTALNRTSTVQAVQIGQKQKHTNLVEGGEPEAVSPMELI